MKKKTIYKKENGDFCCKKIISQQGKSTTRERTFVKISITNNPTKDTTFTYEGVTYKVRKILLLNSKNMPIKRKRVFRTDARGFHMRVRLLEGNKYVKRFVSLPIDKLSVSQVFTYNNTQYQVKVILDY